MKLETIRQTYKGIDEAICLLEEISLPEGITFNPTHELLFDRKEFDRIDKFLIEHVNKDQTILYDFLSGGINAVYDGEYEINQLLSPESIQIADKNESLFYDIDTLINLVIDSGTVKRIARDYSEES